MTSEPEGAASGDHHESSPQAGPIVAPAPPKAPRKPKSIALYALIFGLVAFFVAWLPIFGIVFGTAAVFFGIVALVRRQSKGLAISGLVLGAVAFVSAIAWIIATPYVLSYVEQLAAGVTVVDSEPAPAAPSGDSAPSASATDAAVPPSADATDLSAFAEIDDAAFSAIAADANAHVGQNVIVYGEVGQFDEVTGPCAFLAAVDNTQQSTWEGYAQVAYALGVSGETVCPEFDGLASLDHVKIWATIDGVYTVQFEDGPQDMPGFIVHKVEILPAL